MESFTVLFENAEFSAMYRLTVIDGRVKYELLPGTLAYKTGVAHAHGPKPEIL